MEKGHILYKSVSPLFSQMRPANFQVNLQSPVQFLWMRQVYKIYSCCVF